MKLSIVIVAYNVENYIEKCVVSCLNQDLDQKNYELVIVNDGSTDKTQEILDKIHKKNKDLVIIHQPNKGVGETRNIGLRAATGDYVWFVDGDDYIETNCLTDLYNRLKNDQLDALVLDYKVVSHLDELLNTKVQSIPQTPIQTGSSYYKEHFVDGYFWLFIFKKELFIKHGLKFMKRYKMQDSELLPKVLKQVKRLGFSHSFCYYYVQHNKSSTNTLQGEERYFYFESIIAVHNSFKAYLSQIQNKDADLAEGLQKKIKSIDRIIFNHLLYFKYNYYWLNKILELLKANQLYPIQYQPKGLKKMLKMGLNTTPYLTNILFNFYNRFK